uniref:Uncharacterized protein n=1 Tax=Hyaloperonospora arabidopsidis (strain Emoy2) TaxID=559515 RepID=M4C0W2_HYAAE
MTKQGFQDLPATGEDFYHNAAVRNVETLNSDQNAQLQAQLERADPGLRCAVLEQGKVAKRKEPETALPQREQITGKSKKISAKSKKSSIKATMVDEDSSKSIDSDRDVEELPVEDETFHRMRVCNMAFKHMPVSRVSAVLLKDPKRYRDAIKIRGGSSGKRRCEQR